MIAVLKWQPFFERVCLIFEKPAVVPEDIEHLTDLLEHHPMVVYATGALN